MGTSGRGGKAFVKTLGQIRQTVRNLVRRVADLERKVDTLIDMFAQDAFAARDEEKD
jgi:hypothetical protein